MWITLSFSDPSVIGYITKSKYAEKNSWKMTSYLSPYKSDKSSQFIVADSSVSVRI